MPERPAGEQPLPRARSRADLKRDGRIYSLQQDAYLQIELDDESKPLLTINTRREELLEDEVMGEYEELLEGW